MLRARRSIPEARGYGQWDGPREILSMRLPYWLRNPLPPALLKPTSMRFGERDPETLELFAEADR